MITTFKMPVHNTQDVAMLHNSLLTNECLLDKKSGNSHWNVGGIDFMELHTYFQNHDESADCYDEVLTEEFVN